MNHYFTYESEELGEVEVCIKISQFEGLVDFRILSIIDENGVEHETIPDHERKLFDSIVDKQIDEATSLF